MSSKNKKVQASAAAAADEQDSIVPASSDSTSTTAAGSSFTASSSIPSTNPSTSTAAANEADNIDNEPSASSVAISSLKETGQQLLKDALKVEPQQLMNSLKEQGQAAYMQLSLPPNLNPFGSVIGGGGGGEEDEVVAAKGEDHSIIEKGVATESTKKLATTNTTSSARSTKSYQKSTSQPTEPTSKSGSAVQDSSNSKINVSSPDKKSKDKGSSGDIKDSDNDTDSLVDETDLKQAYPLLLQRSASSAFGSPDKSSKSRKMRARRAHSNSGSDPGAINSAFHPVWSCKSLSTGSSHGSISGSNIDGSEVGSAVSSSIAASTIRSAHSDPFPSIQFGAASDNTNSPSKKRSPWKKLFKNRMKNREKWASFSKREQSLSGRENPARPDLIGDEGAYMSVTVLEGASEEPASPVKASSAQKKKKKKGKRGSSSTSSGSKKSAATKKQDNVSQVAKDEKQYDDPPVALDMSDSDEENDDAFEPIGDYSLNERPPSIVPPSQLGNRPEKKQVETPLSFDVVPCDSVEVISTSVTPTPFGQSSSQSTNIQVVSPNSIEENSPPTVERVTVVIEEAPYHPLGGNEEKASGPSEAVETAVSQYDETSNVAAKLKYRSPKRSSSRASSSGGSSIQHQSNSHQHSPSSMGQVSTDTSRLSSEGSPSSRISSSNSRFSGASSGLGGDRTINTLQSGEGSLVVDSTNYEIREANRRSGIRVRTLGGDSQEVMSGHDGNDTVFSSSTTSSNYHTSSPRKLRDGATMPVDRFFAGGNVAMSPSPQRYTMSSAASSGDSSSRASPGISRFLSSPKTLTRIGASGMSSSTSSSKDTNSPQTVSSNSVANSSSSGSEAAKKPLQFVAYETVREEGESPFDEEPLDSKDGGADERETSPSNTKSSLIKPRISKVVRSSRHRPPLGSPQKPPQSPRVKPSSLSYGRARTPTRTPPPSSYREIGGASTPCSPPAIIDNLALGDLNLKTTKPLVLRRSSSVPQSSSGEPMLLINPGSPAQRESPWPHRRAQHQVPPIPPQNNRLRTEMTVVGEEDGAQEVTMISQTSSSQLQTKLDMNDANDKGDSTIAVVSPEKGF